MKMSLACSDGSSFSEARLRMYDPGGALIADSARHAASTPAGDPASAGSDERQVRRRRLYRLGAWIVTLPDRGWQRAQLRGRGATAADALPGGPRRTGWTIRRGNQTHTRAALADDVQCDSCSPRRRDHRRRRRVAIDLSNSDALYAVRLRVSRSCWRRLQWPRCSRRSRRRRSYVPWRDCDGRRRTCRASRPAARGVCRRRTPRRNRRARARTGRALTANQRSHSSAAVLQRGCVARAQESARVDSHRGGNDGGLRRAGGTPALSRNDDARRRAARAPRVGTSRSGADREAAGNRSQRSPCRSATLLPDLVRRPRAGDGSSRASDHPGAGHGHGRRGFDWSKSSTTSSQTP